VGDEHRIGDPLALEDRLDEVGLLEQRVLVVGRLVRRAEAEEVQQQQRASLRQRGHDLGPVV
jgi:hypothetical protein